MSPPAVEGSKSRPDAFRASGSARRARAFRRFAPAGALALVAAAALAFAAVPARAADAPSEYEAKASLLLNFMKFVEWPADSLDAFESPIVLGVLGPDPFGPALENAMEGRAAGGHPIVIRRWKRLRDLGACHVLFVALSDEDEIARALRAVGDRAVLTVGETPSFVRLGGTIGFYFHDSRIRFEISPGNAERAHLRISSRLLALSNVVHGGK